jgi:hypothetical protein
MRWLLDAAARQRRRQAGGEIGGEAGARDQRRRGVGAGPPDQLGGAEAGAEVDPLAAGH